MKILHTADWHLGKKLDFYSRMEEQKQVMEEICLIAESHKVNAVLIAGDLYDTINPPTEAIELFYKTIKRLANNGKRAVIAIAGNHDSPDRIEAPDPLARECGIIFAGYPNTKISPCTIDSGLCVCKSEEGFIELNLTTSNTPLRILMTPYANEVRLKTFLGFDQSEEELREILKTRWQELADRYCDTNGVNILLSHLYMMKKGEEAPEEPEDEKSILHVGGAQVVYSENIPSAIQYVALGHLHRKQVIDKNPCPIVYSSSPLAYSFSEAGQQKYVMIIDAEPGTPVKLTSVPLKSGKKLYKKKFEEIESAVTWLKDNPDTLVELTIVTEKYLTPQERKNLYEAHDGIINIIPDVKDKSMFQSGNTSLADLSKTMPELFKEYFISKHGQEPNSRLMSLFNEVTAEEEEI